MTLTTKDSAYPYITVFKKEPFKSFVQIEKQGIGSFYFSQYDKIIQFLDFYKKDIFDFKDVSLRHIFWFLLLNKYLREELADEIKEHIVNYIEKCEIEKDGMLGFINSPFSQQKKPDIWSTYYALSSLKIMENLGIYLKSRGESVVLTELKEFINAHDKDDEFIHCLDKNCEICKRTSPSRTLYFVLELLLLLGVDVRNHKSKFNGYLDDLKEEPDIVFKLLCQKVLDLELRVKEEYIQFLHEYQQEDGGYSFKEKKGNINTTFWVSYTLENYSWLLDYNPSGIYSFINLKLNQVLVNESTWELNSLIEISKLIIILSIIWNKFIEEIERALFKEIEKNGYIEVKQLKSLFGLSNVEEEIISYINLNYTFNLKILNNKVEFKNFLRNLTPSEKILASELYEQLSNKSVISLSEIMDKFNTKYPNTQIKIGEFKNLIDDMKSQHFFHGQVKTKKKMLFFTKYYFYLDFFLENIIVSDTKINSERLFEEKKILREIKNDIYNMTLKLKNITKQIREEIESYLYINEIEIAKERLSFIVRNALMEADFLNENIENSFNEDLYYLNLKATLGTEINRWNHLYSILSQKLNEINAQLKEKISEREEIRKFDNILEELDNRLKNLDSYFNKEINHFRKFMSETLEDGYSHEDFTLIVDEFNKITSNMEKFDKVVYNISQKITSKEEKLIKKHKQLIAYWVGIKEELEKIFRYYSEGLDFFKATMGNIQDQRDDLKEQIAAIDKKAKLKVNESDFKAAFDLIKDELDIILDKKLDEIKKLHKKVKKKIKEKQKLYVLFQYLQDGLDKLEENIIEIVAEKNHDLKEKVIKERNRAKIEKFDTLISDNIQECRKKLVDYKQKLDKKEYLQKLSIKDLNEEFEKILEFFEDLNEDYTDLYEENDDLIENFEEKSKLSIMQWEKFNEYLRNEIKNLKEEYTNKIVAVNIHYLSEKTGTNQIDVKYLSKKLNIKCKEIKTRIKEMIEFSKFNGELHESEKKILIYTDSYYKNKELRSFINNKIIRYNNETISKTLSLYDSCIKNRTLGVNIVELTSRLEELDNFEILLRERFEQKIKELNIDLNSRKDYKETEEYFNNIIQESKAALKKIKISLEIFRKLQNTIEKDYNSLAVEIEQELSKLNELLDDTESYERIREHFDRKKEEFEEYISDVQNDIEEELQKELEEKEEMRKLTPELREYFVKKKNKFLENYNKTIKNINHKILIKRNELFRSQLMQYISNCKIKLSQLLGMLQSRVEDYIEIKEFKRAYSRIDKRVEKIEENVKEINNNVLGMVREFGRKANDFETKNKYILDDFKKYLDDYDSILTEKVKSLERLILKNFIEMAIEAVSNRFLTISFLHKELKIKKQNIQDHMLTLISAGELKGKYDPRISIYYEDPEVLENIDEKELQVIKSMNYKLYQFLNRLKNFTSHYSSIIAFFASMLTFSYYLLLLSGFNFFVLIIPIFIILGLMYYLFKKRQEEEDIEM
ncbi:MAG: hypothetical protein GF311_15600 [Candidatus Lokiarchaeota archaeon]|nr:hypothetical protein [Candidatus Lokiarchaeota archaeon]